MENTVEDGAGTTGANAYITEAFLDSWALERNCGLSSYNATRKEAAIVAMSKSFLCFI